MSLQQTINFDNEDNFVFDSTKAEIVGGSASLKLSTLPNLPFTETFTSSTGFTYDATKAEFTGGLVRQKNQKPSNALFGATFTTDQNGSWGSGNLTCILNASAVVSGGVLDMNATPNAANALKIPEAGNFLTSQGAIKFKLTPYYSGAPSGTSFSFLSAGTTGTQNNFMKLYHYTGGNIYLFIKDSSGANVATGSLGAWSPVSGTTYEIELNIDLVGGTHSLFINGVLLGSISGTGTRGVGTHVVLGNDLSTYTESHPCKIDDVEIFSSVQHTSGYTPGYTVPEKEYLSSNVICPEMAYTGAGTLVALTNFSTIEANAPRYTLQVGRSGVYMYWAGAYWGVSDGSYAQATSAADFLAHLSALNILGHVYVQFKVHFPDSNTLSSVSELTATVSGQTYPEEASIINQSGVLTDAILSLEETATRATNTDIKYIVNVTGVDKYWSGSAWVASDGTYAQANTLADILANQSTLVALGETIKIKTILYSSDQIHTPSISSLSLGYDFHAITPEDPNITIVYGFVRDIENNPLSGVRVSASIGAYAEYDNSLIVEKTTKTVVSDARGYWEMHLISNDKLDTAPYYTFIFTNGTYVVNQQRIVPNISTINYAVLAAPVSVEE